MKKYIIATILLLTLLKANSQSVSSITTDELNNRISEGKDTIYVINLWSTWCAPCIKELPYFDSFQKRMKGSKTKVLLVSLDFKSAVKSKLVPFLKKNKITSEVITLSDSNSEDFILKVDKDWTGSIPTTIIINNKHHLRKFISESLTFNELIKLYNHSK